MDNSTQKENKLLVPEEESLRARMRETAGQIIRGKQLVPPVKLNQVASLAQEVIAASEADPVFADFAMVLCGNELWRNIVAATPFSRRLLLLPQCLKNNRNCSASFDKLGLICAGCRNCQIDEILNVAEDLGYATLVAEGTTVAIQLVEEGSVDAVIGVGCMSVLEKSFASVSRAAVPVIGIPLLYDGCQDTEVDKNWLLYEIRATRPNSYLQPLSVSLLKEKVQSWFSEENLLGMFGHSDDMTTKISAVSMLQGGQRMRPILAAMAYSSYAEITDDAVLARLITIIECFHKASLIHDDIEDRDDLRYGKETLHRQHGVPLSINAGDYLIGKGYELLADLPVEPALLRKLLKLVAESHVLLTVGQGNDLWANENVRISSLAELLETFRLKTGSAVKVAVLLGAILGGASEKELAGLAHFSDLFGIAYQMNDDLEEFRSRSENFNRSDFPFLVSLLRENMLSSGKWKDEIAGNEKAFTGYATEYEIEVAASEILEQQVQQLYEELDQLENIRMKLALYAVTGKVFCIEKRSA